MEEDNTQDSTVLPGGLFLHLLQPQYLDMGPEVLRRCALWHLVCSLLPVVRHISTSGLCGLIFWLQVTSS